MSNKNGLSFWVMQAVVMVLSASVSIMVATAQEANGERVVEKFEVWQFPIAILPFKTRDKQDHEIGEKVTDLVFSHLVIDSELLLVDREDLGKVLEETELNLSGLVNPNEAIQIGNLTGAKILVTGSVFEVDDSVYVVAKIIGTETSKVIGASVKGDVDDRLDELVATLGKEIIASIKKNSTLLVAKPVDAKSRIAAIKKALGNGKLPIVFVSVEEQHVGQKSFDPAAQTELTLILKECGFQVIDSSEGNPSQAEVVITGEGLSEYAARNGNLTSVKARLEIKAVDRESDQVIAIDRQTRMAVELGENLAGKQALQEAVADIAERLIPIIANRKK